MTDSPRDISWYIHYCLKGLKHTLWLHNIYSRHCFVSQWLTRLTLHFLAFTSGITSLSTAQAILIYVLQESRGLGGVVGNILAPHPWGLWFPPLWSMWENWWLHTSVQTVYSAKFWSPSMTWFSLLLTQSKLGYYVLRFTAKLLMGQILKLTKVKTTQSRKPWI